jgi:hypothetical protein
MIFLLPILLLFMVSVPFQYWRLFFLQSAIAIFILLRLQEIRSMTKCTKTNEINCVTNDDILFEFYTIQRIVGILNNVGTCLDATIEINERVISMFMVLFCIVNIYDKTVNFATWLLTWSHMFFLFVNSLKMVTICLTEIYRSRSFVCLAPCFLMIYTFYEFITF